MERLLFETVYWQIFLLSEDQTYFGRAVVVLKRPCGALSETTPEEALNLFEIIKKYEAMFKKEYGAIMFNYTCLMNDAYKNIPPDPQVHWHFRPRYNKAVIFKDIEFLDPNFAHHYNREPKRKLDAELEKALVEELRGKFANS
jgi:diadenosine tetraphosphate (Ap4A) HIT family hydrolase